MTSPPVVEVDHATKTFGDNLALEDVSLTVVRGELVGLLGPNGAGKSTLISLLTGLRRPTSGAVRVLGGDPRDPATRVALGTTPQQTGLPETLKVREVVQFVSKHYPDPADADELLARFGLTDLVGRQCGALSGGQQRRLAVALAMLGRPALVLLDEPTTGLDLDARHTLWNAIEAYQADGGTVLVTSHYLEEIQRLAERVVVIDHGRVLVDDTTRAVIDRVDVDRVSLVSTDERLGALPEVMSLERDGEEATLLTPDADALVRRLVTEGVDFRRLRIAGASLEDAFAQLTAMTVPGGHR
ncbi:ABC transporter ATP-binding protein [Aeromicrobium phragmitis]|uniref:ABC transporter ATP-binding protein n=1 Tax=Aeromicrobium phragmitis TaxID=2478914 RepID=A0A3L8PI70_9ACTN|nr:ABC transporter ATP-binding protein [Aeromicrobium phragmitis]RLV54931.1 ABC transporter ATP-binding protein [Aeromicrobium phragmitis]